MFVKFGQGLAHTTIQQGGAPTSVRAALPHELAAFNELKFAWADDQALREFWLKTDLATRTGFIDFAFNADPGKPSFAEASVQLQVLIATWTANRRLHEAWAGHRANL